MEYRVLMCSVDGAEYFVRALFEAESDARSFVETCCSIRHKIEHNGKIIAIWDDMQWQPEDLWF